MKKILLAGCILAGLASSSFATYTKLSGTYVGSYRFEMNSNDTGLTKTSPLTTALRFEKVTPEGVRYTQLGYSIVNSVWKWDFDKMQVTFGSLSVKALGLVHVYFNIYNQNQMDAKKTSLMTPPLGLNKYRNVTSTDEITMPIIDNKDGTYNVPFSIKIYLHLAGWPIEKSNNKFTISLEDGKLNILNIDSENDGKPLDTIPGARIAKFNPLVSMSGFPFTVQPSFYSVNMEKDPGTDSNNDGISDVEDKYLGLEGEADSDNDGITNQTEIKVPYAPLDSDLDGMPDYLEKGDYANNGQYLSGFKNDAGSDFSLALTPITANVSKNIQFKDANTLFTDFDLTKKTNSKIAYYADGNETLPRFDTNGKEIRYKILNIQAEDHGNTYTDLNPDFKFIFDGEVPENFKVYMQKIIETKEYTDNYKDQNGTNIQKIYRYQYSKLNTTKNGKEVTLQKLLKEPGLFSNIAFVIAMGDKDDVIMVPAIKGLSYENLGSEGNTTASGVFPYSAGKVSFKIGNVSIGSVESVSDRQSKTRAAEDKKVYLQDIIGVDRSDTNSTKVLKVAQFLYSLDSDPSTPTIEISDETKAKLSTDVNATDIASDSFDVNATLSKVGITPLSTTEVQSRLKSADSSSSSSSSSSSGGGGSGGSFSWAFLLGLLGLSFLRNRRKI